MNLQKLVIAVFLLLISACNSTTVDVKVPTTTIVTPSVTVATPTITAIIPKVKATFLPVLTPTPIIVRTPQLNDHMKTWGWRGIQVWTSNGPLASCGSGRSRGTDFICGDDPSKNIFSWDSHNPWYFAGYAEMANIQTISFQFDHPYKTILITANNPIDWALDSIIGVLADGRKVPFGYALGSDGETLVPNHLYFDTPNTPMDLEFFIANERKNIAPASVMDCGMVGKVPDNNYTIIHPGDSGTGNVILFRLLDNPNASGGFRGEGAYDLVGVEITYGKVPVSPKICPYLH